MIQRLKFTFLTLLVGAAWLAPAAKADEWNKETVLTFNEPVEIPGQVLPAGTYVFKLFDSQTDREIVQVFTEDQKHLLATIMAIPDYREEPTDKTVVTFDERPSGSPEALHSWFYPGDTIGVEFVYPKSETQFAPKRVEQAAAATPAPAAPALPDPPAVGPPEEGPMSPETIREEEMVIAELAPEPAENPAPPTTDGDPATTADTLPQTAANFAGIPLLGVALMSGGIAAIRFANSRS